MSATPTQASPEESQRSPAGMAVAVIVAAWCVGVLYLIIAVSVAVMYPLGRSAISTLIYGFFFADPYFPHRGKLDLPIALIHAFGLYKSCQWIRRHRDA